jgi:hypothetical protein
VQGCQISLGATYQSGKICIPQLPQNIPHGHKIHKMAVKYYKTHRYAYQHFPFQDPTKFTQIGMKIYNLAIVVSSYIASDAVHFFDKHNHHHTNSSNNNNSSVTAEFCSK